MKERKGIIVIFIVYVFLSFICISHADDDREIASYGYGSAVSDTTVIINKDTYVAQTFNVTQKSRGIELFIQSYYLAENQEIIFDFYELNGEKHIATQVVSLDGISDNSYVKVLLDDLYFSNGKTYFFTIGFDGTEEDYVSVYKGRKASIYEGDLLVEEQWNDSEAIIYHLLYEKENSYLILWIFIMVTTHMMIILYWINHTSKIRVRIESIVVSVIFNGLCFIYWWKCY